MSNKPFWILTAVFVIANLAILIFGASCHLMGSAEYCRYPCQHDCDLALGLLRHGGLVDIQDSTKPFLDWPPAWGLVLYVFLWLSGGVSLLGGVLVNLIALFISAVVVRRVVDLELPGYGNWAMGIILFNPNAIGLAHQVRGETFFAFLIALAFVAMIYYFRKDKIWTAVIVGVLLGISLLVRPNSQYLVLVLPIVLAAITLFSGFRLWPVRQVLHGLLATGLAILIASPWLIFMAGHEQSYRLATYDNEYGYFIDNIGVIEAYRTGRDAADGSAFTNVLEGKKEDQEFVADMETQLANQIENWATLSNAKKDQERIRFSRRHLFSYSLDDYLLPIGMSITRFFFTGGEGYLNVALGLERGGPDPYPPGGNTVARGFTEILSKGFAVVMRVLGLIGLIYLLRTRKYGLALLTVGAISYFMATSLFVGWSRFRLPAEVPLLILATFGVAYVKELWSRRRGKAIAS